jgi:hypothetical protein
MSKSRTIVRVILTILFGIFSLPALIFGLYLFACWIRIHMTDVYYVEYPYLPASLIYLAVGAIILVSAVYGAWRRSFYGLLFAIPVMVGLATMVYLPDGQPHDNSMMADTNYLSSVNSFFRVWYETNHKFPANQTEFYEALKSGPAAWQYRVESPSQLSFYSRSGVRLPYEIVVATDVTGPRIDNASDRPGVIYYCVSRDQQQFWVTMTGLNQDLSHKASLEIGWDDKVRIVTAAGKDYPVHKK